LENYRGEKFDGSYRLHLCQKQTEITITWVRKRAQDHEMSQAPGWNIFERALFASLPVFF
jgi:hypothetical protein